MKNTNESLSIRAKKWLATERTLAEIQDAHERLARKIQNDEDIDRADGQAALDALIESYVDAGGEMFDLYCLPQEMDGSNTPAAVPNQAPGLDLSPLCPHVEPAPPMSLEDKAKAIANIRTLLARSSGVSA